MGSNDLFKARSLLNENAYTCVLIKNSEIFTSQEKGVAPLLKLIDSGVSFAGFCAADKIVGKAAALLYVYMGINELYAKIISASAAEILRQYNIALHYEKLVPYIINRKGDDICPIEKAVTGNDNPAEAFLLIKEKIKNMKLV